MKNFVQQGKAIRLTAPSGGVVGGKGYVIGSLFVVAGTTADAGESFDGYTQGVYELTKDTTADFDAGEKVFFDSTGLRCEDSASGLYMIGVATEAAAAADTTVKVRLDGVAVTAVS